MCITCSSRINTVYTGILAEAWLLGDVDNKKDSEQSHEVTLFSLFFFFLNLILFLNFTWSYMK